jgi:S-adenosylmethionine decarboxylase
MENFVYDGRHLMIDAICLNKDLLCDPDIAIRAMEEIVETIDMTMILPPVTVKFPHSVCEMNRVLKKLEAEGLANSNTAQEIKKDLKLRKEESYGFSTFLMIAESHISIHTFPELNYFSFDCYSCKWFDAETVYLILNRIFNIQNETTQLIERKIPQ